MTQGIQNVVVELQAIIALTGQASQAFKTLESTVNGLKLNKLDGEKTAVQGLIADLDAASKAISKLSRTRRADAGDPALTVVGNAAQKAHKPIEQASTSLIKLAGSIDVLSKKKGSLSSLATEINAMALAVGNLTTASALGGKVATFLNEVSRAAALTPMKTAGTRTKAAQLSSDEMQFKLTPYGIASEAFRMQQARLAQRSSPIGSPALSYFTGVRPSGIMLPGAELPGMLSSRTMPSGVMLPRGIPQSRYSAGLGFLPTSSMVGLEQANRAFAYLHPSVSPTGSVSQAAIWRTLGIDPTRPASRSIPQGAPTSAFSYFTGVNNSIAAPVPAAVAAQQSLGIPYGRIAGVATPTTATPRNMSYYGGASVDWLGPLQRPDLSKVAEPSPPPELTKAQRAEAQFVAQVGKGNYAKAEQELKKFGLGFKDLTSHITDAVDGYSKFTFATETGAAATLHYDSSGANKTPSVVKAQKEQQALLEQAARETTFSSAIGKDSASARRATDFLEKHNFQLKDLKRITEDVGSQTRIFDFQQKDLDGTIRKATIGVNRYGDVTFRMSNQFKGFLDMLGQNVDKVLRWSVAVMAVYGAIGKLQESFGNLVKWDEYMSDIELSTDATSAALDVFFDKAAAAAKATGTSLADVLSIYDDALKTTRSIGDQVERFSTAGKLVNDALIFSRLTGTPQSESLDIIVGSTRQFISNTDEMAGGQDNLASALNRSGEMLDIWVYLSQRGKLSVKDLAEAFATVGATAENTGVSMEILASMTAVMSESTTKSASETANSIKRLMTFLQGESGEAALRKYGIALNDLSGQARSFDSILTEIAVKQKAGAISTEAVAKMGYNIGGGSRGMTEFVALVNNWNEVLTRADETAEFAGGSSQEALAVKSRTLQTAITNLDTSFNNLVRTMGTDGGVTEMLRGAVGAMSGLVNLFSVIPDLIGDATGRMILFGVAASSLAKYGPGLLGIGGMYGGASASSIGGVLKAAKDRFTPAPATTNPWMLAGQPMIRQPSLSERAGRLGAGIKQNVLDTNVLSVAAAGMYTASAISSTERPEDRMTKAFAMGAGAIVSTMVGGGPIIGAAIGDAVSETIIRRKAQFRDILQDAEKADDSQLQVKLTKSSQLVADNMMDFANKGLMGGYDLLYPAQAALKPDMTQAMEQTLVKIFRETPGDLEEKKAAMYSHVVSTLEAQDFKTYSDFNLPRIQSGVNEAANALWEYDRRGEKSAQEKSLLAGLETPSDRAGALVTRGLDSTFAARALEEAKRDALKSVIDSGGKIPMSQYKQYSEGLTAVKDASGSLGFLDFLGKDPVDLVTTLATLLPEARDDVLGMAGDLRQLEGQLQLDPGNSELARQFAEGKTTLEELVNYYLANSTFDFEVDFSFAGFTDFSKFTKEELEAFRPQVEALANAYAKVSGQNPADILAMGNDAILAVSKEGGIAYGEAFIEFLKIEGMPPEFLQIFASAAEAEKQKKAEFNMTRLRDLTPEMYPDFVNKIRQAERFLESNPAYEGEYKQMELVIDESPQWRRLITTQEAMTLAMEALDETMKKQLEGMWNIPEGATVMVPLTSLYYAPKGGAGETDTSWLDGGFSNTGLETLPPASDAAASSLYGLADAATAASSMVGIQETIDRVTDKESALISEGGRQSSMATLGETIFNTIKSSFTPDLNVGPGSFTNQPVNKTGVDPFIDWIGMPKIHDLLSQLTPLVFKGIGSGDLANPVSTPNGGLGGVASEFGAGINAIVEKLDSVIQAFMNQPPIIINTTTVLDGAVVAKSTRTRISEPLQGAARSYGYTNGSIIA